MGVKKYRVEKFTLEKVMAADGAMLGKHVELMQCLFEIDIAPLRQKIKQARQEKKATVSLVACLLYCYSRALHKNPDTFSFRSSGNKLYFFDEADAFFPVEINQDGRKFLWYKIIRAINTKTVFQLEDDIRSTFTMTKTLNLAEKIFFPLPYWLKNICYNFVMGNPLVRKMHGGNVYFSSAIHSGNGRSATYGIPSHFHTSGMFIGMYREETKPDGTKANILAITLSLDHIIGDGFMLAKLYRAFLAEVENFEIGNGS